MDKKSNLDANEMSAVQTIHPTEDYRGLTIYQVMVGSFIHSENGAEGYSQMWGPDKTSRWCRQAFSQWQLR